MDKATCIGMGTVLVVMLLLLSPLGSALSLFQIGTVNSVDSKIPDGGNEPPVADAGGPYYGRSGEEIVLDGSGSYDPDGTITAYRWYIFGEWFPWSSDPTATVEISTIVITMTVTLQVKDDDGATDMDTATVVVPKSIDNEDGIDKDKNSDSAISADPLHKFLGQILSKNTNHNQMNPFINLFNNFKLFNDFKLKQNSFLSNSIKNVFQNLNIPTNNQQNTENNQSQKENNASEQQTENTNNNKLI